MSKEQENRSRQIFAQIDRFFDENRPKEAEQYMLRELEEARGEERRQDELTLLNELIGYYRQTSQREELLGAIQKATHLSENMGLAGTIPYATTLVNAANGCRSIGELKQAMEYYEAAESIYDAKLTSGGLSENDMLLAGFYNNFSLLCQERADAEAAEKYQLKALAIAQKNNAGFEIAVTHANLANTYLLQRSFDRAEAEAKKSMELFQERGFFDPHYCAALSALGTCRMETGEYGEAKKIFQKAGEIVSQTIGRNAQYDRLMELAARCEGLEEKENSRAQAAEPLGERAGDGQTGKPEDGKKQGGDLSGMELSRRYFEEYGRPMIREKFPHYQSRIAAGLVGEGSDCFGYDDEASRDHDFGPEFCLWLNDKTYEEIGEELAREYELLPDEFMGFKRNRTEMGSGRRGVQKISDFYEKYAGAKEYDEIDFSEAEDHALAACTNGEIFYDGEDLFSDMRRKLKEGYPERVRLLKLAEAAAGFSQCGQYNYERMKQRGDEISAHLMLADFCKHTMKLYHYLYNTYPPHDKWLAKSTSQLVGGKDVLSFLEMLWERDAYGNVKPGQIEEAVENLAKLLAGSLYASGEISDIDPYLGNHVPELLFKAQIAPLSDAELVDRIARLEFEAFDKVKNEGGRASCQNDWPTFSVMRKSQYMTWDRHMLMQYLYDFTREYEKGHNLITEKYGRMMESTAPERYEEIKDNFPELTKEKKTVIEQIVALQMEMAEAFAKQYPLAAGNARKLHTYEDDIADTSYETYLRGEISTYSDKMLQLYGAFVVQCARSGINIARQTIENTARLYGYANLEEFEAGIEKP